MNHIVKYNKPRAGSGAVSASGAAVALQSLAGLLTEAQLSVILEGYLLKETFDDLFVKEPDGKGGYRIQAKYALYSNQYLSCLGNNPDAGTVALGATTLGGLNNVVAAADEATAAAKVLVREAGASSWSLKNLSDIVGLDTSALATYLNNNHYATQQWVQLQGYLTEHQSLADYAKKTWVEGKGYLTAITKAQVEAVLTGDIASHTHSQYLTSALAAQTYQPKGDYALTSALNSAVSSLNTAISAKLDAATFNDLFVKESDGNGGYRIKAKYALYSNQYISCLGNNPDAGTTTGGGVDLDAVAAYLQQQGYATQSWVQAQGYITSLSNYYTKAEVDAKVKYLPTYYGSRPTSANVNFGNAAGLYTFLATSSMTTAKPANDGHILHLEWDNRLSWAAQIAVPCSGGTGMQWRYQGASSAWQGWRTLLDSSNYASVLNGKYVTVDTAQTISGVKTLGVRVGSPAYSDNNVDRLIITPYGHTAGPWKINSLDIPGQAWLRFLYGSDETITFSHEGVFYANSIRKRGGTSSQFLKADGSVDSNTYLTAHQSLADYAKKTWVQAQGYLTAITKAQVEAVLTGNITSHTHSQYLTSQLASQTYQPKGDYALNSALTSAVNSLNTAISAKLDTATFNDLFVKESDGNGGYRIKAKYALYSNQYLSCLGNNPDAGTSPGGGVDLDAVAEYLQQQGYATQSWVQAQGYVTALGVSGNYLTWTKNGAVNNITVPYASKTRHLEEAYGLARGSYDSLVELPKDLPAGVSVRFKNSTGSASSFMWATVLSVSAFLGATNTGAGYRTQLLFGNSTNQTDGSFWVRSGGDSTWGRWQKVLTAGNYTSVLNGTYVTLGTPQEIAGQKTFTYYTRIEKALMFKDSAATTGIYLVPGASGELAFYTHSNYSYSGRIGQISYAGALTMNSFVKAGGTSSQMLMADGSVLDESGFFRSFRGGIPTAYIDLSNYNAGASGYANYPSGTYTVGRGGYSELFVNFMSTTGSASALQFLTSYPDTAQLLFRKTIDSNRVTPWRAILTELNIGNYALTPSNYASTLDGRYVNASGDTMTGRLAIITGQTECGIRFGGNTTNADFVGRYGTYVSLFNLQGSVGIKLRDNGHVEANQLLDVIKNGRTLTIGSQNADWCHFQSDAPSGFHFGRNVSVAGQIYAGPAYNQIVWHAGNDGHNSGLDADLLDGVHSSSFMGIASATWTDGETVVAWAKRLGWAKPTIYGESNWGWASAKTLTLGGYTIDSQRYAAFDFRAGNLNEARKQKAIMFLPTHSDATVIYIAQMTCGGTAGEVSLNAVRRYATYDTILASNVASATKLQTARSLWGNSFDGTGDISGNINLTANHSKIGLNISNQANDCPWYGLRLSCAEGWHVMLSGYYGTSLRSAGGMLSLAQSGNVGIGTTAPSYKLHAVGDIMAEGWLRTTGAVGWYNQTYAGGWHMDNATWIKAWQKPVYIAYAAGEGANSFGVGLRCYSAGHTSVEVQGGSYTMGLGCHSNGSWYWWRGTSSSKYYVMQYDGTTWNFTGVLKTSTGMYSDGYMSCLGQNTGSDMRLKHIIGDVTLSLDMIADAPAKLFRWRYGEFAGRLAVGSIAQYWQQWLAPVVSKRPDDYLQMDYGVTALTASICLARITRGIKSEVEVLKEKIIAQDNTIAAQNNIIAGLQSKINELERRLAA